MQYPHSASAGQKHVPHSKKKTHTHCTPNQTSAWRRCWMHGWGPTPAIQQ